MTKKFFKSQTFLICAISALIAALVAALILILILKKEVPKAVSNDGREYSSITSSEPPPTSSSESPTSNVSSEVETSSNIPSSTPPPTPSTPTGYGTNITAAFGQSKVEELMGLNNTGSGWGQGVHFDNKNRPTACLNSQAKFGKYGAYYIMPDEPKIYLTFDQGYEYQNLTASILDTLKDKDVKAVFFLTLSYAKQNPALVQRMIDEGHILGNHSSNHPSYPSLSLEQAYNDMAGLHNYIKTSFGYDMKLFRFPSGEHSERCWHWQMKWAIKRCFGAMPIRTGRRQISPTPLPRL